MAQNLRTFLITIKIKVEGGGNMVIWEIQKGPNERLAPNGGPPNVTI